MYANYRNWEGSVSLTIVFRDSNNFLSKSSFPTCHNSFTGSNVSHQNWKPALRVGGVGGGLLRIVSSSYSDLNGLRLRKHWPRWKWTSRTDVKLFAAKRWGIFFGLIKSAVDLFNIWTERYQCVDRRSNKLTLKEKLLLRI